MGLNYSSNSHMKEVLYNTHEYVKKWSDHLDDITTTLSSAYILTSGNSCKVIVTIILIVKLSLNNGIARYIVNTHSTCELLTFLLMALYLLFVKVAIFVCCYYQFSPLIVASGTGITTVCRPVVNVE